MSQVKPKDTLAGQHCPYCEEGHLVLCQVDYKAAAPEEPEIVVRGVWVEKCPACGEMIFPAESSDYITNAIAEETEQLTPAQLKEIRDRLGVDQTQMSEILGLGDRTYHRWEKGTQYPSRSMCYYIRLLGRFHTAFDWLRKREWRTDKGTTKILTAAELASRFPDLFNSGAVYSKTESEYNPARGLSKVFASK